MKILLTGMNGFLGKNLTLSFVKNNFKVLSLVRSTKSKPTNIKIITDDIGNLKKKTINIIKSFQPETVVNLAWHGIPDYSYKNCAKNFLYHVNFLDDIKKIKSIKKLIMIGSSWEYHQNSGKCMETDKINLSTPFSWSKNSIYQYLKKINLNKKGMKFVWLRVFFMYGKYQNKHSLLPHIIKSLKNYKRPKIHSPNNKNDFIHVEDVCEAIILAIKNKKISGIYNVGNGKLVSNIEIYNKVLHKLKKNNYKYRISYKKNKHTKENYANTNKIYSILKWKPKIDINQGINKVINQ